MTAFPPPAVWLRVVSGLAPFVVFVGSCSGSDSAAPPDAKGDVSIDSGSDEASTDAESSDALSDGASSALCDGTFWIEPSDAATGIADGQRNEPVDAGTPPTSCFAPCVWELIKSCLPVGLCATESYSTETWNSTNSTSVSCWPSIQRWSVQTSRLSASSSSVHTDVYLGDRLCYSHGWSSQRSGITSAVSTEEWRDGAGQLVASALSDSPTPTTIYCGPPEALALNCFTAPGACDQSEISGYDIDSRDPACAAWLDLAYGSSASGRSIEHGTCQRGCCPGEPPDAAQ
jgi:hypothetical protein